MFLIRLADETFIFSYNLENLGKYMSCGYGVSYWNCKTFDKWTPINEKRQSLHNQLF